MIEGQRVLAIIPARGGSKGLPGKNIRNMCGKPLIAWSIEKAKLSKYVDTVLVSTDSQDIADISLASGAEVPFLRPAVYSTDEASTYDVIRHALSYFSENQRITFDLVVLLEPTSPLREDDDIDRMLASLTSQRAEFDSIISVGEINEHPSIVKRLDGKNLVPFYSELTQAKRRQDNSPAYFPFGVAYIAKTAALLSEDTFYTKRCTYFVIKRYQNCEIDDFYNFLSTEATMVHEWGSD
jgi:CMP-N-acetylneuraminic acid synthetase